MDVRRCPRVDGGGTIGTDPPPTSESVDDTHARPTLIGLLLVLLAIPLAFSFAPFVIGVIVLAYAARRAHVGLAANEASFGAV